MVAIQAVVARQIGVERFGVFASAFAMAAVLSGLIDFGATLLGSRVLRGPVVICRIREAQFWEDLCRGAGRPRSSVGRDSGSSLSSPRSCCWRAHRIGGISNVPGHADRGPEEHETQYYALLERLVLGAVFSLLTWLSPLAPEFTFVVSYICASPSRSLGSRARRSLSFCQTFARSAAENMGRCSLLRVVDMPDFSPIYRRSYRWGGGWSGVAGAYGACVQVDDAYALATQSFSSLLNPIVSAAQDRHDVWRRMRKSVWLPAISVLAAVTMAVFAEPLVLFVLGRQFIESVGIMRLMALAAALSSIAQVAFTVLQARRRAGCCARAGRGRFHATHARCSIGATFWCSGLAVAAIAAQSVLCLVLGRR